MSSSENNLLPNEQVLYIIRPHFIIFFWSGLFLLLALFCLLLGSHISFLNIPFSNAYPFAVYNVIGFMALAAAIICGIIAFFEFKTSIYEVTNMRVLIKTGFIHRVSFEIYLQKIESVQIYQTMWGRILNYGAITIMGVGGSYDRFFNAPNPFEFRRKIQEQIKMTDRRAT